MERNQNKGKEETIEDRYKKRNKNVGQKAIAIQCWNCKGWYYSHSRCGVELERIYNLILQIEEESKKRAKESKDNQEKALE